MLVIVRSPFTTPGSHLKQFAFRQVHKKSIVQLLICLALVIGLYRTLPWMFSVPLSGQLIGRWQLQTQIRNGSRVQASGEYEFRSDYTTRKLTSTSSTRAGLWIIRAPVEPATPSSALALLDTTVVTNTYQFIDSLTQHFSARVIDQHGTPDANLWPGEGIYEIMITNDQLILRTPDRKSGGWIVLECTRISSSVH